MCVICNNKYIGLSSTAKVHVHENETILAESYLPLDPHPDDSMAARNTGSNIGRASTVTDSYGLSATLRRNRHEKDIRTNSQRFKVSVGDYAIVVPTTIVAGQNHRLTLDVAIPGDFSWRSWNIKRVTTANISSTAIECNCQSKKLCSRFQNGGFDLDYTHLMLQNWKTLKTTTQPAFLLINRRIALTVARF